MAENKKYFHNLDAVNNKVMNLLLNPLTTAQRLAVGGTLGLSEEGYVCYDTTLNQQYFWDGTQWITSGGGGGGVTGSGTLNYIAKWTPSGTQLGNSQLFDNSLEVGIGTITPTARLTVQARLVGSYPLIGFREFGGNDRGGFTFDTLNNLYLTMQNSTGTTNVKLNTVGDSYFLGGSVGVGTSSPNAANKLEVVGVIASTSGINVDTSAGTKTGMYSGTNSFTFWAGNNQLSTYTLLGNTAGSYFTHNMPFNNSGGASGTQNAWRISSGVVDAGANSMIHNQLLIDPQYVHGTLGTGLVRGVYYNPTVTSLNGASHIAWENTSGDIIFGNLSGSGTRLVTADSTGKLSATTATTGIGDMLKSVYDVDNDGIVDTAEKVMIQVLNNTGAAVARGTIVYLKSSSASASTPEILLASNTSEATSSKTIGAVYDLSIANGATGYIVTNGEMHGNGGSAFNTSAYNVGDKLWLGATPGSVTTAVPSAPAHAVFIGIVTRSQSVNGRVFYAIQNGFELGELHNVSLNNPPSDNDGLFYETSTSLWKNKSIATVLGYTPQAALTLTTSGTSGAATLVGSTLNIPQYSGGGGGGVSISLPIPKILLESRNSNKEIQILDPFTGEAAGTAILHRPPYLTVQDITQELLSTYQVFIEMVHYKRKGKKSNHKDKAGFVVESDIRWDTSSIPFVRTWNVPWPNNFWNRNQGSHFTPGGAGSGTYVGINRPNWELVTSVNQRIELYHFFNSRFYMNNIWYRDITGTAQLLEDIPIPVYGSKAVGKNQDDLLSTRFPYSSWYTPLYVAFRYILWDPTANNSRGQIISGPLSPTLCVTHKQFPFKYEYGASMSIGLPCASIHPKYDWHDLQCNFENRLP